MASGIETRTQLYEILDKIQDNLNSNDTYSNMKLYFNEMMKTAVIYQIVGDEGLSNDISIVAIFNPERILLSELEYFKGAILKNVNVINVDSIGINEIGLGGFIDFDRLINNICVALGVKLGKNFAKNNPLIYSELRNICIKYTSSLNNSPYFMQEAGTSYYSLVPYNIVLDVAIYLNSIGLFNVGTVNPFYFDSISFSLGSMTRTIDGEHISNYYIKLRDFYDVKSKSEYINGVEDFINYRYNFNGGNDKLVSTANAFFTEYEGEIDFNNNLYFTISWSYTDANNYTITATLREFTASTLITFPAPSSTVNNSIPASGSITLYNGEESVTFTKYQLIKTVTGGSESYSYNKEVTTYPQNTLQTLSNIVSYGYININFNKYISGYALNSSSYNLLTDLYNSNLQNNTRYTNIKFRKIIGFNLADALNNKYNLWTKDDLAMFTTNGVGDIAKIYVFKNVTSFLSDVAENIGVNGVYAAVALGYRTTSGTEYTVPPYIRRGAFSHSGTDYNNHFIDFGTSVDYEIYTVSRSNNDYTVSLTNSGNAIRYTFNASLYFRYSNVGAVVKIEPPEVLQDITLESGATYPQDVIDSSTFISTYPNWYRQDSYQPEIDEDGQVLNSRTSTTWINLDVDNPSNQSEAQEGNLDNADLDTLIRDVDKAEEDDDTDDPSSDDDAEDEGEIEETDPEDVPSTLIGFLQQLVFPNNQTDIANLGHFMMGLYSNSFLDIIKNLALGNPIEGLVSFVATYDGLWNEDGVTTSDVVMWGQTLTYEEVGGTSTNVQAKHIAHQIKEIDLGTIDMRSDLPDEYTEDNYTDITERELGLYLPFVGMVNLDIRDFIGKQLELKARVDSVTGTIIYNVYSKGDGFKHLNQTFSGNCQSQIPLKSADFSQLMRNIANTSLGAVGALTLL